VTRAKAKQAPVDEAPTKGPFASYPFLWIGGGAVAACVTFLLAAGTKWNVAALFLVGATAALVLVVRWTIGAARALLDEPKAEEVRLATGRRRKELEREKQALLKAIKELEFDHEMGKISDGDYQDFAAGYRARTVRVMRQLDEQGIDYKKLIERDAAARAPGGGVAAVAPGTAAATEKAVPVAAPGPAPAAKPEAKAAEAKADPAPSGNGTGDGSGNAEAASTTTNARPKCPSCSTENDADATFCKRCATKMTPAATESAS
jgi:hypothetical protein